MLQRYPANGRPTEFPVRSKCISLFQKIHGVDTLLFAMYVYEYGHDCPAPNRRRVYISYLDSVKHFEPKCYRTVAYQAILVEYLRYVKERGFHTAHIWSCPPTPGDDYIFYSHPSKQLIPHEDMLRTWYHQMLATAKAQGVVIRTTTLYDEYFTSEGGNNTPARGDPTCLPYFEGDYIPGELENIIKLLKRDGRGSNDKSSTSQDEVMRRLGHNLSKMKDNFIVVHLRSRRFAAAVERGEDVSEWLEDSDEELVRSKRAKISGKDFIPYSEEKPTQDSAIATDDIKSSHPALAPIGATKAAPSSESQGATETSAKVVGEGEISGGSKHTSESQDATETSDQVMGEGVVAGESKATPESQDATDSSSQVMGEGEGVASGESNFEMKTEPASESQDATETSTQVPSSEAKSQADETAGAGPVSESVDEFKKEPQPEVASEQDAACSKSGTEATAEDVKATPDENAESTLGVALPLVNEEAASQTPQDMGHFGSGSIASKQLSREEPSVAIRGEAATASPTTLPTEDPSKEVSADKATESQEDPSKDISTDKATESLEAVTTSQEDRTKDVSADKVTESGEAVTTSQEDQIKGVSTDKATESREAVTTSTKEESLIDGSQDAAGITSKDTSAFPGKVGIKSEDNDSISAGSGKRGIDEIGPALSRHAAEMKNRGPKFPVASTVDEDEPMDSEMFESRQQFLNYCQTNHCQFDELRRTKHSTMMVLFQLHNPMAPLVLNQCGACYRDITHGVRYHCNDCSNFDLCQECYEPVTTGLWAQRDPRFAHAENHSFTPVDMEASEETEKTREERQLSLKSHLDLLEHVASCGGPPDCSLHNCLRMKKMFEHVSSCEIKPKKECKVCTRLFSLCSVHARTCRARGSCPIPFCDRIRESNKRRRQQQQQMDDRRRRAQNELYHAGGSEQV
jgi:hypothetical protein